MSTNFEKISSNKVKLTFVVPAEDFDKALNQAYLKDRSKINVPGFRKGKAPRAVIERMYGEGVFYDDALDAIFPALYAEAIKEHNIDVVDRPQVDVQEIGAGKELKFTAEVFVRPDVTLRENKNLHIEIYRSAVGYGYAIVKADNGTWQEDDDSRGTNDGGLWDTYEEALEAGIIKALSLL